VLSYTTNTPVDLDAKQIRDQMEHLGHSILSDRADPDCIGCIKACYDERLDFFSRSFFFALMTKIYAYYCLCFSAFAKVKSGPRAGGYSASGGQRRPPPVAWIELDASSSEEDDRGEILSSTDGKSSGGSEEDDEESCGSCRGSKCCTPAAAQRSLDDVTVTADALDRAWRGALCKLLYESTCDGEGEDSAGSRCSGSNKGCTTAAFNARLRKAAKMDAKAKTDNKEKSKKNRNETRSAATLKNGVHVITSSSSLR
jgi:hypothetical protein